MNIQPMHEGGFLMQFGTGGKKVDLDGCLRTAYTYKLALKPVAGVMACLQPVFCILEREKMENNKLCI